MFPIDYPEALRLLPSSLPIRDGDRDPLFQHFIDLLIRRFQTHRRAITGQGDHGGVDRLGWQRGIQLGQGTPQGSDEHHFALCFTLERTDRSEGLLISPHRLPPHLAKESDRRLLDQLILGVGVGAHEKSDFSLENLERV